MTWSNGLVIAVTMVAVPLVMRALLAGRGKPPAGTIRYSVAMKVFGLVIWLGPTVPLALVLLLSEHLKPDDVKAIAFMIVLFSGLGGPLAFELFGVRHAFDDQTLDYRSPWSSHRTLRWAEVTAVKWGQSSKWLVLRDGAGKKFRLSPLSGGLGALAETALRRIPPGVLAASPTGAAVLELMRRGKVFGLVLSQDPPEQLVRDLRPEP